MLPSGILSPALAQNSAAMARSLAFSFSKNSGENRSSGLFSAVAAFFCASVSFGLTMILPSRSKRLSIFKLYANDITATILPPEIRTPSAQQIGKNTMITFPKAPKSAKPNSARMQRSLRQRREDIRKIMPDRPLQEFANRPSILQKQIPH
jgi:hypothetical protein